jgi:hypothetical protein
MMADEPQAAEVAAPAPAATASGVDSGDTPQAEQPSLAPCGTAVVDADAVLLESLGYKVRNISGARKRLRALTRPR